LIGTLLHIEQSSQLKYTSFTIHLYVKQSDYLQLFASTIHRHNENNLTSQNHPFTNPLLSTPFNNLFKNPLSNQRPRNRISNSPRRILIRPNPQLRIPKIHAHRTNLMIPRQKTRSHNNNSTNKHRLISTFLLILQFLHPILINTWFQKERRIHRSKK